MNWFDSWSSLGTTALAGVVAYFALVVFEQLPLANGLLALALLVLLQYAVAWLTVRAAWFRRLIRSEPTLLFRQGEFLEDALRASRINRDEVVAAARREGVGDLADIEAILIETDGSFSVLRKWRQAHERSTLEAVAAPDA
jgi:uncharacterized membrane protein YcaP (DUF421 family)